MSSITIRNLDDSLKASLRLRAARNGLSMEQYVRNILQTTLSAESGLAPRLSFAQRINQRFKGLGVEALAIPERREARPAPNFDAS